MKQTLQLFKNGNYTRMLLASFASQTGTEIGVTAFLLYLLKEFSTKPYLATLTDLMNSLPILLVFFLVGVVADRFDRQKVAYYSDFISAGFSVLLMVGAFYQSIPFMFATLFGRKVFQSFFSPAERGIIQGILKEDEYTVSAGLNNVVLSLLSLFGRGLGVFFFLVCGVEGAILIDAVSFLLSAVLVRSCRIPEEVRLPNGTHQMKELHVKELLSDFYLGLKYIWTHSYVRTIVAGYFFFGMVNACYALMPIFYLKYKLVPLDYEKITVWEGIVIGSGILVGSFVISAIANKTGKIPLVVGGLLLSGTSTILTGFTSTLTSFFLTLFVSSFFLSAINMGIGGILPTIVEPKFMGRVGGSLEPVVMLSGSLTLMALSVLFPSWITVESLFWGVGALFLVLGTAFAFLLPYHEKHHIPVQADVEKAS